MTDTGLTPQQIQVVDALSSGANLTEAAALAGVHRNTVARWRRNFARFHAALAQAHYDRALLFRERAEALADAALETLRQILADPNASPSVRFKAATFIIEIATTQAPPKADKVLTYDDLFNAPLFSDSPEFPPDPEASQPVQAAPEPDAPAAQKCTTAHHCQTRSTMHQDAPPHEPYRRPDSKTGRNEPCPCGSGRKYKRCCLGKPLTAAA